MHKNYKGNLKFNSYIEGYNCKIPVEVCCIISHNSWDNHYEDEHTFEVLSVKSSHIDFDFSNGLDSSVNDRFFEEALKYV